VNMNARIYDSQIGRFLSADPLIGSIYDSQALNRYSYVGNDPLSLTDPTGLCFLGCFWHSPAFSAVASIAVAVTGQEWALPVLETQLGLQVTAAVSTINAGISGGLSGYVGSGKLQGAELGAGEALAFAGVHFIKTDFAISTDTLQGAAESAGIHGLVGGVFSVASRGTFASGFLAAGTGDLAGDGDLDQANGIDLVKHSIAGGLGSVLGGGKFTNGAETGSFAYLFTAVASGDVEETYKQYAAKLSALGIDPTNTSVIGGSGVIDSITTGSDFTSAAQPIYDQDVGLGQETGGVQVYQAADGLIQVVPFVGGAATCSAAASACMSVPNPDPSQGKLLFEWHPHPNNLSGSDLPSETDLSRSLNLGVPGVIWSNTGGSVPKQVDYQAHPLGP
jgi:hypothetical protein